MLRAPLSRDDREYLKLAIDQKRREILADPRVWNPDREAYSADRRHYWYRRLLEQEG